MLSKQASYINFALKKIGFKTKASKDILNPKRQDSHIEPPKNFYKKYHVSKKIVNGHTCITLEKDEVSQQHLFYFHGGAYSLGATKSHWKLVDYIMEHTGAKVSFINYPLYPESTCKTTVKMALKAYKSLADKTCEIILAGDSAGGGLALALAQVISNDDNYIHPEKLLLFSPWIDLTMNQDISSKLQENDLILTKDVLIQAGVNYAGSEDPSSALCSPIFGDANGLGQIALFTGTHDILYPQAMAFNFELLNQGIKINFHCYDEMQHVWVMLPIPEATQALNEACDFINQ